MNRISVYAIAELLLLFLFYGMGFAADTVLNSGEETVSRPLDLLVMGIGLIGCFFMLRIRKNRK